MLQEISFSYILDKLKELFPNNSISITLDQWNGDDMVYHLWTCTNSDPSNNFKTRNYKEFADFIHWLRDI